MTGVGSIYIHTAVLLVTPAKAGVQKAKYGEMVKQYCVYILASKKNGTLYIGVTNNLLRRVYEHRNNSIDGFTRKYGVHKLVYYETTDDIESAITKEKQLKKWKRDWKIEMIEKCNPEWNDLYYGSFRR